MPFYLRFETNKYQTMDAYIIKISIRKETLAGQ